MTPTEIKKILSELGGHANKRLGQNFLIDKNVLQTIVETANIKKGDHVLEIGPGLGVLTRALIEQGADVTAIEQDPRFVEYLPVILAKAGISFVGDSRLRGNDKRGGNDNLRIVHGDAATIHWHDLIGNLPWKFVSNLPYSITSLALRKALWTPKPPDIVVTLVQREVAERAISVAVGARHAVSLRGTGKTSLLSLMVALASREARIVKRVSPGAFYPAPKVESAILEIIPMTLREREEKWGIDPEKIMAVAKLGFAHPRKFLISNLGFSATSLPAYWPTSLNPKTRAEDLAPAEWAALAKLLDEAGRSTHPGS